MALVQSVTTQSGHLILRNSAEANTVLVIWRHNQDIDDVIVKQEKALYIQWDLTVPNYRKAFFIGMHEHCATHCILHWLYCWTIGFIPEKKCILIYQSRNRSHFPAINRCLVWRNRLANQPRKSKHKNNIPCSIYK